MANYTFEQIDPNDRQIEILYDLLAQRDHSISHREQPSFEAHKAFVDDHPYRAWFLVFQDDTPCGSFYVTYENTIGINIACEDMTVVLNTLFGLVGAEYPALPAEKSVRAGTYSINVAPTNEPLLAALQELDAEMIQLSFRMP